MSIFTGFWFSVKLFFAGLFPQVEDVTILSLAILICIIAEFAAGWVEGYLPILDKPLIWIQKHILIIAMILGGVVFGEWRGAHSEAAKWKARAEIINTHVDQVNRDANGNAATQKDKWEVDK